MESACFEATMGTITMALIAAGYEPLEQLYCYVNTGNPAINTRRDAARDLILSVGKESVRHYLNELSAIEDPKGRTGIYNSVA